MPAARVSAFSAANGGRVWSQNVTPENEKSKEGFGGGLALDGGRLYAATGFGTVVALDPGNGAVVWTKRIGEPVRSAPTAAGGKIYFVSAGNMLYALNADDGQQLWTSRGLPQVGDPSQQCQPRGERRPRGCAVSGRRRRRLRGRERQGDLARFAGAVEPIPRPPPFSAIRRDRSSIAAWCSRSAMAAR